MARLVDGVTTTQGVPPCWVTYLRVLVEVVGCDARFQVTNFVVQTYQKKTRSSQLNVNGLVTVPRTFSCPMLRVPWRHLCIWAL